MGLVMIGRSLEEMLVAFGGLKGRYNAGFVAAYRAKVLEAERLPSEQQRVARAMAKRLELREAVLGVMDRRMGFWRSYIRDAWKDKEARAIRLVEAGFGELRVAKQMNWEVAKGVLKRAVKFLGARQDELMAGENMPVGFVVDFGVMAEEICSGIDVYLRMRMELKVLRQTKVRACNEVYKLGMEICGDGKVLFKRNAAVLRRFTWKDIMGLVTPAGASDLREIPIPEPYPRSLGSAPAGSSKLSDLRTEPGFRLLRT